MATRKTVNISETVQVGTDDYLVVVTVTRPAQPALDRDMDTIKAEITRLLPGWIKSKIQAGDP